MPTSADLEDLRALRSPLVVYVGHELSRAAGLPSRRELACLLVEELPEGTPARRRRELIGLCARDDLTDAFTELDRELTTARFGLVVERAWGNVHVEIPPLASALACLGARLQGIVTPNLDRVLERAFMGRLVCYERPRLDLIHRDGWLLKLHGTISDRTSWVFTRDQHGRVSSRDPVYGELLRSLFLGKPMLFVGAAPDDPIFDAVVTRVRDLAQGSPPRHWALLRQGELTPTNRTKLDEAGIAPILCDSNEMVLEILASLAPNPAEFPPLPRPRPSRSPLSGQIRILFVSANPHDMDTLAVDHEQRAIHRAIERAPERDRIELVMRVAASFADLSRTMLDGNFDIVHVSGHGEPKGIIVDEGGRRFVRPADLAALFDAYAHPLGRLRCVVLNSCWSATAGLPILSVPVLITMDGQLDDRAALAFTEGFYDAIGAGRDLVESFHEGQRRGRYASRGPFEPILTERTLGAS